MLGIVDHLCKAEFEKQDREKEEEHAKLENHVIEIKAPTCVHENDTTKHEKGNTSLVMCYSDYYMTIAAGTLLYRLLYDADSLMTTAVLCYIHCYMTP